MNELSIIIPTYARKNELEDLLCSLQKVDFTNILFEILIIDQNPIGFIDNYIVQDSKLNIKHINVSFKGLSKAKNFGFNESIYSYVIFLDDDSKVYSDTFIKAFKLINKLNLDLISGKCIDNQGKDSVQKFRNKEYYLNIKNFNGGFIESTAIIKRKLLYDTKFDENIGVGEFFGAHEGYDWIYRIIKMNTYKLYYSNTLLFFHPQVLLNKSSFNSLKRVNSYSYGFVYTRFKNQQTTEIFIRIIQLILFIPFCFITFSKIKFKYHILELFSILSGIIFYFSYLKEKNDNI
jgi:glycosyltransferase involved in cell wall biosynthesis